MAVAPPASNELLDFSDKHVNQYDAHLLKSPLFRTWKETFELQIQTNRHMTPAKLQRAAQQHRDPEIARLLQNLVDMDDSSDRLISQTALHSCASYGHRVVIIMYQDVLNAGISIIIAQATQRKGTNIPRSLLVASGATLFGAAVGGLVVLCTGGAAAPLVLGGAAAGFGVAGGKVLWDKGQNAEDVTVGFMIAQLFSMGAVTKSGARYYLN